MNEKKEDPSGMTSMVDTWLKSMADLAGGMTAQWSGAQGQQQPWTMTGKGVNPKAQETMNAAFKNWQSMANAMAEPDSISALLKGSGGMPEMMLKLSQSSLSGFWEMQQSIIERLGRMGATAEAYEFQNIDENIFRIWTDIYQNEFKKFFQIPQLGLMRTYQEKANRVADEYNRFQSTLSEFLNLMGLPFNQTMQVMQGKVAEMAEKGELPEESRVYYNMWVKVLEGHYMTLFQTPEYVETLARTINAQADFSAARDSALEDILGLLPVAKRSDMDEMARELYELKKRLRILEKEHKK